MPKSRRVRLSSLSLSLDLVRYHSPKKDYNVKKFDIFFTSTHTHSSRTLINAPLSSSEIIINARRQTSSPAPPQLTVKIFFQLHFELRGGKLRRKKIHESLFLVNRIGKRHAVHRDSFFLEYRFDERSKLEI